MVLPAAAIMMAHYGRLEIGKPERKTTKNNKSGSVLLPALVA